VGGRSLESDASGFELRDKLDYQRKRKRERERVRERESTFA
jgi:hypothetical protein